MSLLEHKQLAPREPLYDVDPRTRATIEVFYADRALAVSFGLRGAGWVWWSCTRGLTPDTPPRGPFATSYGAYRAALSDQTSSPQTRSPRLEQ